MDFRLIRMIMRSTVISPENKLAFLERISKNAPVRSTLKVELARGLEMNISVAIGKPRKPVKSNKPLPPAGSVEIPYCA